MVQSSKNFSKILTKLRTTNFKKKKTYEQNLFSHKCIILKIKPSFSSYY